MRNMLFLDDPNVGEPEKRAVCDAIDQGYVSTFGPFVPQFEEKFAAYLGAANAVSTQSGTAALHMALYELGIGPKDEVIVPALTFVATANPVTYVGAKAVFADVDIRTWNLDPAKVEKLITKKTKAIIPVHLYGNPCDMGPLCALAKKHGLYIVEDATESLGATYRKRFAGLFGDMGCFSFNGNKIITTGGGGMIVGKNSRRLAHIKHLVNQARDKKNSDFHHEIGFNYRMTNLEASLGLAQMERLKSFLALKREFSFIYREELGAIQSVHFQEEYGGACSSWWITCAAFAKVKNMSDFQERLKKRGIPTRRIFMPVTEFFPYKVGAGGWCSTSHYLHDKGLCLPSSTLNTKENIAHVCKVVKELIG